MKRVTCRVCDSSDLRLVYDFGQQPLAGKFPLVPESEQAAQRFMLDLTQCNSCGLLQVTNLPPIEAVFHDDYRYSSSEVPMLVRHFDDYADWLEERLPKGASVLEFGCNDGVLLERLDKKGFSCVGVDASDNVAQLARAKGIQVHTGFMREELVRECGLEEKHDLVTCSNVLAHIDDVLNTIAAVRLALKPGGLFVVEVHDAVALARDAQFETIYHEHLSYFTEMTLRRALERSGFAYVECSTTPMHGGALRFLCRRHDDSSSKAPPTDDCERIEGSRFATVIERCTADIRAAAAAFGLLDGYGAAGRAQMFINMTGTADCFARIFDDSVFRQNRFIVGTDIPILPFASPTGRACIILAWNYALSIAARICDHYEQVITVLPQRRNW